MDESGHDHRIAPWEVRGGICLHASKVWDFVQKVKSLEYFCFGDHLHRYKSEIKGEKLLKAKRFRLANQCDRFTDPDRQEMCRRLLAKGARGQDPTFDELGAYGQASLRFVEQLFALMLKHGVKVFASRIPRGAGRKPEGFFRDDHIRKDQYFLLQRYAYFLASKSETGILVLDESDRADDKRYLNRMEHFFLAHSAGKEFSKLIFPGAMFVASDMSYPVQVADVVLYCLNWAYRGTGPNEPAPPRPEIEHLVGACLEKLICSVKNPKDGFRVYSVVDVPDPWQTRVDSKKKVPKRRRPKRKEEEKEGNAVGVVFRARPKPNLQ